MLLKEKGFTLIELMVVIVIIAILLGLAVMNFGRFTPGMRYTDAQERVLGAMRTGRLRAVTKETSARVILTSGGAQDSFYIDVLDPRTKLSNQVWVREGKWKLPAEVKFTLAATPLVYTFLADGSVAIPAGAAPRLASQTRVIYRCSLEVVPASGMVRAQPY